MSTFIPSYFYCSLFCFLSVSGICQNQSKQWYFGNGCGLDFNTEPPTPLLDNGNHTMEGCASISDENGELLFYTNGTIVKNKNHVGLENGYGLNGHTSSSQSALIVPWPLNENIYYVFTTGIDLEIGLQYSIIDMSQNDGSGAVIEKNIPLLENAIEKQTAVPHANGRDYWIVTHLFDSDEYYSYLVSCEGVQENPIISPVGSVIEANTVCCNLELASSYGYMKASPNGKMIATTWTTIYEFETTPLSFWHLEVLDFNQETGELSNAKEISQEFNPAYYDSYGVCFSPDNSKLYQGTTEESVFGIFQYDLLAPEISASQNKITEDIIPYGGIEIGPDGKLYAARFNGATFLTIIENPNDINPTIGEIDLMGKKSTWGLPNLIYDYESEVLNQPIFLSDTVACVNNVVQLDVTIEDAISYQWNDGSTNPMRNISAAGIYYVDIETGRCGIQRDSIVIDFSHTECATGTFCNLIDIHPNPFYDDITLDKDYYIYLFDSQGKKIYYGLKSEYSFKELSAGMYFIRFENCRSAKKIIKLSIN